MLYQDHEQINDRDVSHLFQLGDKVEFQAELVLFASGYYEIVRHLPPTASGEPQYLIKSRREVHSRVVKEAEVKLEASNYLDFQERRGDRLWVLR